MAEKVITEEDLQARSKTELIEMATACDIETKSRTKAQLIDALRKFVSAPSKEFYDAVEVTEKVELREQSPPTLTALTRTLFLPQTQILLRIGNINWNLRG